MLPGYHLVMVIPQPTTVILSGADLDLGRIPGPLAIDQGGETLWLAGGGRGESIVLRYHEGGFRRCAETGAAGLRAVLALDSRAAIVAGEYGYLARTDDGGASFRAIDLGTRACLYAVTRDREHRLWVAGDDGLRVSCDGGATFERAPGWTGRTFRVVMPKLVVGEHVLSALDGSELFRDDSVVLNDAVDTGDGVVLVGDGGRAWRSRGASWQACDLGTSADLERVAVVGGTLVVLASDGALYHSVDAQRWEAAAILPGHRLTGLWTGAHGWLVTGWRKDGPPYRFVGALAFLGPVEHAPKASPPRPRPAAPAEPAGHSEATAALIGLVSDRARWAAELSVASVTALLDAGADLSARTQYGQTALALAVTVPWRKADPVLPLDILELLLARGADLNAIDIHGQSIVELAAREASDAAAEPAAMTLLARLVEAGARFPEARSPVFTGSAAQRELLLEAGARVDVADPTGALPLHRAVAAGKHDIVAFLLAHGADPSAIDGRGRTPLRCALREIGERWVAHNGVTPAFRAIIAALREAGGVEARPFPWNPLDVFAPRPIDNAAVGAACAGPALRERFRDLLERGSDSAQDLVADLYHEGEHLDALNLLAALATTLGEPRTLRIPGDLAADRPLFWHGDLIVEGSLAFQRPSAITGNVTVAGIVTDGGNDSRVTIGGNLACQGLLTDGDFAVGGDIEARDVVWGHYNDFVLAARAIRARVVIEDDHMTNASVDSPHHFDIDTFGSGAEVLAELRQLFVADVFDEDAHLDRGEVFRRLAAGEPVFRAE